MSAEIIRFPTKISEYDHLPTEVIEIDHFTLSSGQKVRRPTNRYEYQMLCKELLSKEKYDEFLLAILDDEYFQHSDKHVKTMVECYLQVFDH